jgi:hypothetical protein
VNTLPWSYTFSGLPTLFGEGSDTALSKLYTVPSTTTNPYPSLPLDFPTLARYLQSALEDSRRAIHDSSSGLRKLAKLIDSCYPNEEIPDEDDSRGSEGFTQMLKNFIRRGNKGGKQGRKPNEETYQYVTPFFADGY